MRRLVLLLAPGRIAEFDGVQKNGGWHSACADTLAQNRAELVQFFNAPTECHR